MRLIPTLLSGGSAAMVGGHEYAETVTDSFVGSGWYDPNDSVSGGEIGDKCVWGGHNWGGLQAGIPGRRRVAQDDPAHLDVDSSGRGQPDQLGPHQPVADP